MYREKTEMEPKAFAAMVSGETTIGWEDVCKLGSILQELAHHTRNDHARFELAREVGESLGIQLDTRYVDTRSRISPRADYIARVIGYNTDGREIISGCGNDDMVQNEWSIPKPGLIPGTLGGIMLKLQGVSDRLHEGYVREYKSTHFSPETPSREAMRGMLRELNRFIEATQKSCKLGGSDGIGLG
jgi:hypothetical protein